MMPSSSGDSWITRGTVSAGLVTGSEVSSDEISGALEAGFMGERL
jgi:hypothetical protein